MMAMRLCQSKHFGVTFIHTHTHTHTHIHTYIQGGADKSLARPTSRCRRMELTVSLERQVCSCAELQVFSCYRGRKEACQVTCAISTTSRHKLSSNYPPPQGKTPKEIYAILAETLGEHAPLYATVKNWVAQFKRGDFSTCDVPCPGRPISDHPRDY